MYLHTILYHTIPIMIPYHTIFIKHIGAEFKSQGIIPPENPEKLLVTLRYLLASFFLRFLTFVRNLFSRQNQEVGQGVRAWHLYFRLEWILAVSLSRVQAWHRCFSQDWIIADSLSPLSGVSAWHLCFSLGGSLSQMSPNQFEFGVYALGRSQ